MNSRRNSALFIARALIAVALCFSGVALALFVTVPMLQRPAETQADAEVEPARPMPIPDGDEDEAQRLTQLELYWADRIGYPTGHFNPEWMRAAAKHHAKMEEAVPAGSFARLQRADGKVLNTTSWTGLGPSPERMTGCTGCFDYTKTAGRTNEVVVDPTTTTNGSIVAYAATDGGGVWKTTNCCSSTTTWKLVMNDPLIATTAIGTLAMDPNDHKTLYAGTGDLRFGNFSFGSQGVLKTTDGGQSWVTLGAEVFGPAYPLPAGSFPQYNAIGKVKVDPNNSNTVVVGSKLGLHFSYDGGQTWEGPYSAHGFAGQREDITGLELVNIGGTTRMVVAVGVRGFASMTQILLGNNGGNGVYVATLPTSGNAPAFTPSSTTEKGFIFGTQVTGSPYTTGQAMNGASGTPYGGVGTGNQLGRIDIAVAPSNPNVIYAQVQSIAPNNNNGCGNTSGCQLGAWYSNDGGATWNFMAGSQGGALRECGSSGTANSTAFGDYPQNWYDQHVEVDPNDPNKVWFDTHEVWFATQNGNTWYNTTCVYNQPTAIGVHADQHAITFVPGSSSIMILAHDGGVSGATDANLTQLNTKRPAWFNMDNGFNTIEFYAGDIGANFATAANPEAVGGAQDNGPSSVRFNGTPTGPAEWQMGLGGDGFSGQVETVDTQATGTITLTSVGAMSGETFQVGGQIFTFQSTARTGTGQVQMASSTTTQGNNIVAAINEDVADQATAARSGATVTVAAAAPGPTGNAIVFTENATNMAMNGSGTLGGTTQGGLPGGSRFWEGNNSGGLSRCDLNCTQPGAVWQSRRGAWTGDLQSFILPINLFHGGIPGGDQCNATGASTGCGHLIAGTTRVWETVTGSTLVNNWYITNNPAGAPGGPNLTKGTLGNRSYINQVKYSPKYFSVAIVGTNDGNVQIGFNLGTGMASQANWVNVTGNNAILPNRPILGISLDPSVSARETPVGYAAVGGFNANTPSTPGHLFQVTCTANCASFTWLDKTGNLPDIPVASVINNPNHPQQVFAGTDWGVYFTNDITAASPVWYRFNSGMPHTMIWDMQIDKGATTLSAWTRGRGAWVYPLPAQDIGPAPTLVSAASRMAHGGEGEFNVNLPLTGKAGVEPRRNADGKFTVVLTFDQPVTSGTATVSDGSATANAVSFNGNTMVIELTGVSNQQTILVSTKDVVAGPNTQSAFSEIRVAFLQGDVNGDSIVNSGDAIIARSYSGQSVNATNYRADVNAGGAINSGDAVIVRNASGKGL